MPPFFVGADEEMGREVIKNSIKHVPHIAAAYTPGFKV